MELALAEDYQVDWHQVNHEQLVYCREEVQRDGKLETDYKWSVLATRPEDTGESWVRRKGLLQGLNMTVPTKEDLMRDDRMVLDAYLAHGLGIELHNPHDGHSSNGRKFDFKIGSLPLLDKRMFVLTLDFAMKMLCINERIECKVPCIMEGETGVSKTALTRMLFALKNTPLHRTFSPFETAVLEAAKAQDTDGPVDENAEQRTRRKTLRMMRAVAEFWNVGSNGQDPDELDGPDEPDKRWRCPDRLAAHLCHLKPKVVADALLVALRADPSLDPLAILREGELRCALDPSDIASEQAMAELLKWYVHIRLLDPHGDAATDWTFFPIDIHGALTPSEIANDPNIGVRRVVERARRLLCLADLLKSDRHNRATLCIFFDEVNTSSCMGVFKELVIDHSLDGERLPENIVIVAAGNPARDKIEIAGDRREELGNEWAIGHYQVHPLPASM